MLDRNDELPLLEKMPTELKCEVELPSDWTDFFEKTGPLPIGDGERRRFPRYYYRSCAVLIYSETIPAVPRPAIWHKVYTEDISRGGLSFLHSEQLYPREQMQMVLAEGGERMIEVVRSRRIQHNCYRVGARFVPNRG